MRKDIKHYSILLFLFIPQIIFVQTSCDRTGISNGWMLHMSDSKVDQITKASATTNCLYFRSDFAWSDIQYNGPADWNWENVDRVVNAANTYHLQTIAILDYFPPWADVTTDTIFWSNFVYQAGLRYIPQGIEFWEMWNEPNIINFWPQPNVADYVNLILIPGANAIRKAAQELGKPVFVITGGVAPAATDGTNISQIDFVKGIYANGGKPYFDAIGHHPYCWPLDPAIPNNYNWFLKTQDIRDVMVENGDFNKQIWGTEMGWPTHSGGNGISEIQQANYLSSAYDIWNQWSWTGPLIWYAYNDAGTDNNYSEDNFGMVDFNFNPKPALSAFELVNTTCADNTTTVDVIVDHSSISLFPNPIQDYFSIRGLTHQYDITIVDDLGNTFQTLGITNSEIEIDIQSLPIGIYFVRIQRKDYEEIYLRKILKI